MRIMNSVWVLTALWASLFAIVLYFRFGREKRPHKMGMKMDMGNMKMGGSPIWYSRTVSTLHCGAGCTLADLIGEWAIYLFAITIAGSSFLASITVDYILALAAGILFQYAAIRAMSAISPAKAIGRAAKADILSLTAWQIGMYGFMAIAIFGIFANQLPKNSFDFWFMMQISMFCGFLTALPVNVLLIKFGIKKAM